MNIFVLPLHAIKILHLISLHVQKGKGCTRTKSLVTRVGGQADVCAPIGVHVHVYKMNGYHKTLRYLKPVC